MLHSKCIDCKFSVLNALGVYCDCKLLGCEDFDSLRKIQTDDLDKKSMIDNHVKELALERVK